MCVCSFHVTAVKKYFDDHLLTLPHMGCEVKASRVLYRITLTVIYKFFLFTSGWINLQILRRNLTKSVRGRDFTVCRLHHTHVPREQTAGTTQHQNLVTLNLRSKKEKRELFSLPSSSRVTKSKFSIHMTTVLNFGYLKLCLHQVKVSKYRKQTLKFSFEPKRKISALLF